MGGRKIKIGDRSGPEPTEQVLRKKNIYELAKEFDVEVINFDELGENGYQRIYPPNSHWKDGFLVAKPVFLAGTDRIAIDAVGIAILKELGSNKDIMERKIFEQEQIARGVELDLGVKSPLEIKIKGVDSESSEYAKKIVKILTEESS